MEIEQDIKKPIFSDQERVNRIKKKPQIMSLNDIYPQGGASQCGYCHKKDGSFQWSFTKKKMEAYTYELLMERGWRRCGTYYYKPNLERSCCKLFTHRLQVEKFKPKKDQKKALKRVIALAYQRIQQMQCEKKVIAPKNDKKKQQKPININQQKAILQIQQSTKIKLSKICQHLSIILKTSLFGLLNNSGLAQQKILQYNFQVGEKLKFFVSKPGDNSDYYCNYVMLLYGLNKKLFGNPKYSLIDFSKDVKQFIENLGTIQFFKLSVERGGYLLFQKEPGQKSNSFEILQEKQEQPKVQKMEQQGVKSGLTNIMQTIKNKLKGQPQKQQEKVIQKGIQHKKASNNFQILQPNHKYKGQLNISFNKITFGKITVDIVPAEESVQSFKLYQQYSTKIHQKKQKQMSSYVDFLCLQALQYRKQVSRINNQAKGMYIPSWDPTSKHQSPKPVTGQVNKLLGCYHMKYFFQGKLLAVGVVDMVDDGLSSVYFFYDPAFKQNRFGVFSSLIEIQYIRWMQLSFPEFRYYYMGFYISNSQKMNYKVDYMPCELLCPITYRFVDFSEEIKLKTDRIAKKEQKDIRLSKAEEEVIQDMLFKKDLGPFIDKNLKLIYNGKLLVLKDINPHFFVHILKILKVNVPVLGRKVFEMLTFSV